MTDRKKEREKERSNKGKSIDDKRQDVHDESRTELHQFKDEQLVDDIPLEEVKIEEQNQKQKNKPYSQNTSQTEKKYKNKEKKDNK